METKARKSEQKRRKQILREQRLEEFRLALLALSDEQIDAHFTIWIDNLDPDGFEEDAALLEQIATMLRAHIEIVENGRTILFDYHLRERIAYLSLHDVDVLANLAFMAGALDASAQRQSFKSSLEEITRKMRRQ